MLSLLTPAYQKRMVQGIDHESVTNAPQWSASFCQPEGFLRFYTQFAVQQPMEVMMNPYQVQFLSGGAARSLAPSFDCCYLTVIGTVVWRYTHSSSSSTLPPPWSVRAYFSVSTRAGGLLMVIGTRPRSWD